MAEEELPKLQVTITPRFNHITKEAVELHIKIAAESIRLEHDFLLFEESFANISGLEVLDEHGTVELNDRYKIGRPTSGDLRIRYTVACSSRNDSKIGGIGLHGNSAGLLGSGLGIMPIIPSDKILQNTVQWDLNTAPEGTRAVWTFGEGPDTIEKIGYSSLLQDSVFMVGPIKSSVQTTDHYGYYWFGDLPPNIQVIRDIHHEFFLKASDFFSDSPSVTNPYRNFIQNTRDVNHFGGTKFSRSYIFNYEDQIDQVHDYDLIRRQAYEMAHLFLGPSATSGCLDWLFEGIAGYLSICFPFRFKFRTGHYFQATINMLCTRYYTNPLINLPYDELLKLIPTNEYAKEQLYARAWAFVIGTDFSSRRMSELMRPIEDLAIKPMAKNKAEGKSHGIEVWLQGLKGLMGDEAQARYNEFLSGDTILLHTGLFGANTHYLKPIDMEVLDFGMERSSFDEGVVKGLKTGSRAEKAGLREGDRIAWSKHVWRCVDHFEETMELDILRDGKNVRIKYWPRGFELVESWWMVKRDEEGELEKWLEALREEHKS